MEDLPVELWLEILSYLPRSALHNMIGVSRTTFELAMNDLYEEIRFIDDDKATRKMFQQLAHRGINERVRRLTIRPAFLPGMDEDLDEHRKSKIHQVFSYVKHITLHPSTPLPPEWKDPASDVVHLAESSLKDCPNLRQLDIIVHDLAMTPLFSNFLHSLLGCASLGPRLTSLTVDTTISKLAVLFEPLAENASHLNALETLNVCVAISRFDPDPDQLKDALRSVSEFAGHMASQLRNITLSSDCTKDISTLFQTFPTLVKAKRLDLLCVFSNSTIPKIRDFNDMIARQATTLEHLVLSHRGRHVNYTGSDHTFNHWLANSMPGTFSTLRLPQLRALEVDLRSGYVASYATHGRDTSLKKLYSITPALTSLTIGEEYFNLDQITEIVSGLPKKDDACILEHLKIWVDQLTAGLFDYFDKALRNLESLELHTNNYYTLTPVFYTEMQARRYPTSPVRYLRITSPSGGSCPAPHPCATDMNAVSQSFPHTLRIHGEMECDCKPGLGSWRPYIRSNSY